MLTRSAFNAFLFAGSRGVGKTTSARILARALNCEEGVGPDPCGVCHQCKTTLEGRNPDVVEIDAASHNLVDDIRDLRDRVGFASMGARTKPPWELRWNCAAPNRTRSSYTPQSPRNAGQSLLVW